MMTPAPLLGPVFALAFALAFAPACTSQAPVTPQPPHSPAERPDAVPVPAAASEVLVGAPPATTAEEQAVAHAKAAAKAMGGALKGELKAAIAAGGPLNGIAVCNERAPLVARQVAAEQGVTMGRSSLRLRNPDNAGPPWVQAWLQATGEREAAGLSPQARIVDVDGRRVAHLAVPLAVEPVCLACHGPTDSLDAGVTAALAERYPDDHATGYAVGELRGVLWVEAPVEIAGDAEAGTPAGGSTDG